MKPLQIGCLAWALLVLLQPAWYLWLAPPAGGSPLFALLLTLPPLLLPLLALRTGVRRAVLWVGIISLFYFCHGIVAAWVIPSARLPALLEVVVCVILICTLGVDARSDKRQRAAKA